MARPSLKRLLTDIDAGLIDAVVVYKVDRLTRSLADFARILEALDKRGVAFVSVTQAFNTNSSMGRLTLNVLLSFAQFERDVIGRKPAATRDTRSQRAVFKTINAGSSAQGFGCARGDLDFETMAAASPDRLG